LYFLYYYRVLTNKTNGIPTIKSIAITLIGRVSSSLISTHDSGMKICKAAESCHRLMIIV